jgi:hypothetical protein
LVREEAYNSVDSKLAVVSPVLQLIDNQGNGHNKCENCPARGTSPRPPPLSRAIAFVLRLAAFANRDHYGKAAGLRTTLLVCLAASTAMIQVNLLLPMAGKASDSFIANDSFVSRSGFSPAWGSSAAEPYCARTTSWSA